MGSLARQNGLHIASFITADHFLAHTGGDVRELDFQFHVGDRKIGAPFHGLKAFFTTPQLSPFDKVRYSYFPLSRSKLSLHDHVLYPLFLQETI